MFIGQVTFGQIENLFKNQFRQSFYSHVIVERFEFHNFHTRFCNT